MTQPIETDNALAVVEEPEDRIAAKLSRNGESALADQWRVAQLLARSHYFQDASEAPKAFTKILAGAELGFGPVASMRGVYIVKGQVTYAANLIGAAIQKSRRYRYRVNKLDASGCSITFFERNGQGWEPLGESDFSPKDAEAAGLKGDNWQHFPRNMYFARALTNGARWYCPDVFDGPVYSPDEMGAVIDDDGHVIDVPQAPPVEAETAQGNAKRYDGIYGPEDNPPLVTNRRGDTVKRSTGEVISESSRAPEQPAGDAPRRTRSELWAENRRLSDKGAELGITAKTLNRQVSDQEIETQNAWLREQIGKVETARAEEAEAQEALM
jgi:hypothetical protein